MALYSGFNNTYSKATNEKQKCIVEAFFVFFCFEKIFTTKKLLKKRKTKKQKLFTK